MVELVKRGATSSPVMYGLSVRIGNTDNSEHPLAPISTNKHCGDYNLLGPVAETRGLVLCHKPMSGRYLTIQIVSGAHRSLEIDEVNVYTLTDLSTFFESFDASSNLMKLSQTPTDVSSLDKCAQNCYNMGDCLFVHFSLLQQKCWAVSQTSLMKLSSLNSESLPSDAILLGTEGIVLICHQYQLFFYYVFFALHM